MLLQCAVLSLEYFITIPTSAGTEPKSPGIDRLVPVTIIGNARIARSRVYGPGEVGGGIRGPVCKYFTAWSAL